MDETLEDYCAIGPSESLRSLAHGLDDRSFPLFVCIRKKGINLRRSQHLVYLHQKKRMSFALCVSDKDQSTYTIPVGKESGIRLLPATRSANPDCILPSELLACKTPPNIVFVSKSFVASAKGGGSSTVMLREGTLLFPQEMKHKKKATVCLLVKTDKGAEITIDLKCTGRFSVSFGPDFDLLHTLKTFKETVKLPMNVSICRRDSTEPQSVARLRGVGEEWALCGIMTNELGEERGKLLFRYRAELLANLPYTAQKMVPKDSNSPTAMQLQANYHKAMSSREEEEAIYDNPDLVIYQTVEAVMMPNPAYDSCGGGIAAASGSNTQYINLPYEEYHEMPEVTCRDGAVPYAETSPTNVTPTVMRQLSEALTIHHGNVPPKCSDSSHTSHVVNTGSVSKDLCRSKLAVKLPVTAAPLKKLPLVQHPESDAPDCRLTSPDMNVTFLKTLDIDMVQRLLSAMNMSQHRDRFLAEQVDGEILACCDAESLQELGVTSRIQQIRLAKIIDGTYSAAALLNK